MGGGGYSDRYITGRGGGRKSGSSSTFALVFNGDPTSFPWAFSLVRATGAGKSPGREIVRLIALPAGGVEELIHFFFFFALPSQRGAGLVHVGLSFALWGGCLVQFSPLPCPSKTE